MNTDLKNSLAQPPRWRATLLALVAAVLLQVLILVALPARKALTLANGRPVLLKVEPVDPYSILSGYYVTLGYPISRPEAFANGNEFKHQERIYAIIERGEDGFWKPLTLARELPRELAENQLAIYGQVEYRRIEYGIETLYIPETRRHAVAEDLRLHRESAFVEVKIDAAGNAALERLHVADRVYE